MSSMTTVTQKPGRVAGSLFLPYKGVFATCLQDTQRLPPLVQTHESQSRGSRPCWGVRAGDRHGDPPCSLYPVSTTSLRRMCPSIPQYGSSHPPLTSWSHGASICISNKLAGDRHVGVVAHPFGGAASEPCFSPRPTGQHGQELVGETAWTS